MENIDPLIEIISILTRKAAEVQSAGVRDEGFTELSLRQSFYLEVIARCENPTPTELARIVKVTKPSITAAIDKLERMGLIRKAESDGDRRSYHLHMSDKGREIARVHHRVHEQLAQQLTNGLEPEEIKIFMRLVQKIVINIQK
ncbi:MAG: MarR family winged helix-turn-helix transcriptional regulator [Anaerolineaceae bacterium]